MENFSIAFGDSKSIERLSTVPFKSADLPRQFDVLGAKFTAISEADGKILIKVESGMPLQPFAVHTTREIKFYPRFR